ncbi:ATP-binding cassette domain-containing protein [Capnocytophaga canis]|uniref:ABC transporter ATP-binding protein n=1 Tax=Capnocytophaga canis TaxID=1848903 RepID=UPI001562B9BD|nr:ATP-binding cassette domain-containing protein [Capnocytophaga canis]
MIRIQNLDFSFHKKVVFQNLNLQIEAGQICGLFGKNGVGKTTLLYNLTGLLFPHKGKVEVLGFEPKKRQTEFLQEIFLITDEVYLPDMSIRQYEKTIAPFYPKFDTVQFLEFLNRFEIPSESQINKLSLGQRKKVLISFALATNTAIVLMDEPTNGLDIMGKTQFQKILAEQMNDDRYFIISTHQAKDLENLIDRVIVLDNEKILFNQSVRTISEKLNFKISENKAELSKAFYAETNFFGNVMVLPNHENTENRVDLELLYKAVTTNSEQINQWFNSK